ncbi:uncharacterized protein LOC131687975 [Topomyia yanbarensis]|uniref:uncharacterized protein LOC131687975 n=1 Tax=Topomyia yanbarensis TaxID=2498891 RepID=UPI00273CF46E|nr:uncharacterized protein LOC131687975 [Topomyia yanbarensis]
MRTIVAWSSATSVLIWYHFVCVGVTEDVQHHDFICPPCGAAKEKANKKRKSSKASSKVPSLSTNVNVPASIQVPVQTAQSASEAALLDRSAYIDTTTAVTTSILTTAPVIPTTELGLATNIPPYKYAPTVPQAPVVSWSTTIPSANSFPPLAYGQFNQIPTSSLSLPYPVPPPALPKPSCAILPPNTCESSYYPGVLAAQNFAVPSCGNQLIPSLHYSTPLSSRNAPITTLPNKTTQNTAITFIGNKPSDTKKQGREEILSQRSVAASSRKSKKDERLQLELQILDEERKLQEEEQAKKREYLQKKHTLLREMANDSTTDDESEGYDEDKQALNNKVTQWIQEVPQAENNPIQNDRVQSTQPPLYRNQLFSQFVPEFRQLRVGEATQIPSRIENSGANIGMFNPARRSTPRQAALVDDDENNLSRSQIAARQAVSRELPTFTGIPEEWPLFYSTFITTTNMCGYTSEENLVRIQKCLKGKAYEAIKCRLMHPSNVPGIISTLKMLYGNPDVIVHNLIAKIKSTPPPRPDRLDTLIEFSLAVQNLCATIEACQLDEYSHNVVLLRELVEKLPSSVKVDWAKYRRTLSHVNLTMFSAWLYELAETVCPIVSLSSIESKVSRGKRDSAYLNAHMEDMHDYQNRSDQAVKFAPRNSTSKACVLCKGSCTSIDKCTRFAEFSYNSRWATVKEFGLCWETYETAAVTLQSTIERECNTHLKQKNKMLFRVVPVILYGIHKAVKTFAFLDDGSSLTLIDAALAAELNLNGIAEPLCLRWTSTQSRSENDSVRLSIEISGTGENHKKYRLQEVHTVSNLDLFHQSINMKELAKQHPYLRGIPVESYQDAQPRILIGMDNANLTLPLKGKEGGWCQPIVTKTRLGWIIHGGTESQEELVGYHSPQRCLCSGINDTVLQQTVNEYFSLENVGISKPKQSLASTEDQRAADILKTVKQTENGHYVSRLLWKYDEFHLPNSKPMALQRFRCLESRLKKDPELAAILRTKIEEYLEKGYARKLMEAELAETRQRIWYLPIFPVFNPNKPGKVRIVWDAAAKTNGVSLNSMMLTGPDQLTSLLSVLIQFRENRVAICGDLREMFHQVRISEEDQNCLRFLWRENPSDAEPSTYVMQVMTFGACCSPSCAQYVKNLNAEKHGGQYPKAANAIIKNHYVDDMLTSTESEEEAIQLAREVRHVHAQGGFEIRNWISNSPVVLNALQKERIDEKSLNLGSELATEKVLGLWWCTATDTLTFKLSPKHDEDLLSGKRRPTKREVLRTLMTIFDPLGLLSHLLIFLKILLQEIWRSGVGWDDEIPDALNEKWEKWLKVLPSVRDVRVPRCYRLLVSNGPETNVQLHTFVDASEDGYAAVVYLRFQQGNRIECSIVAAKSRVAPLKFVSIPRLELQAAVAGARLANMVTNSLSFKVNERLSPFVSATSWKPAKLRTGGGSAQSSVADEATKWQRLPDLGNDSRWFKSPEFLWQERDNWPVEPFTTGTTKEEIRSNLFHHRVVMKPCINAEYFSNWKRLVGTVGFVFRFLCNCRSKVTGIHRKLGPLSSMELQQASNYLFREAQRESFPEEVAILLNRNGTTKALPKQSAIYTMKPFLDENQLMRMFGRISRCEYATMDAQNPVVLPKDHHITKLLVRDYHERFHHCNHETVINELRQKFRIPKLRVVYRNVRANCQKCKNQRAIPQPPPMGDLPKVRLAAFCRPFTFVGVDYFGPIMVALGRRSEKRWGVLVTCLTTRAVYIEVAHTLNADSCVMAIRNFMARRGVPNQIFSDRGTNFTAANKELGAALAELDQEKIVQEIVSPNTEWCFIPPASPHMGGSWERLIQSVKRNLEQIRPRCYLSDEVLRNQLIEIEGTINSRPLTHVPADDPDAPVLTPNHFILGSSSGLKPATLLDDSALALKRSWRNSQVEANIFWRRWVRDYMPDLTRRTKWFSEVKAIEVGDIVVIADPDHPRNCWPKGRIISVNRGKDGKVRSAAVQTAIGGKPRLWRTRGGV